VDTSGRIDQEQVSISVLAAVREFLGGPHPDGDDWAFDFGEHLESNWGAVYGGALAAGILAVARAVAPARSPRSLHIQIVRSVPRGIAHVIANVLHAGRTVTTVQVDLRDKRSKLAVSALVTLVSPGEVAADHHDTAAGPLAVEQIPLIPEAWTPPVAERLGMIGTGFFVDNQQPGIGGRRPVGLSLTVPWEDLAVTGPEAACLAADAAVGGPLTQAFGFDGVAGPNADLSLRFTTAHATRVISGIASMLSLQHGTATVGIEVQAGDQQLAHGLATSLLLPPKG
jgi:acyl-coenzyme A thioesterase PaaI-like protein